MLLTAHHPPPTTHYRLIRDHSLQSDQRRPHADPQPPRSGTHSTRRLEPLRAVDQAEPDPQVRVVTIRGRGGLRAGDLNELLASADKSLRRTRGGARLGGLFVRIRTLPKLVVAVVHGRAFAGGPAGYTCIRAGDQLGAVRLSRSSGLRARHGRRCSAAVGKIALDLAGPAGVERSRSAGRRAHLPSIPMASSSRQ